MLYDELVKRATMASIALDKEDFPAFEAAVDRCTDIVNYLDETLVLSLQNCQLQPIIPGHICCPSLS